MATTLKSIGKKIEWSLGYLGFRLGILLFAHLPFFVLFWLSDGLAFLLYRVLRYRKGVVMENLEKSFPEKTPTEIEAIAKGFYRHLSDIFLEALKGLYLTKADFLRRYRFKNPEVTDQIFQSGRHVFAMPAHYGNWEWGVTSFPLQVRHAVVGVYKPIHNPYIEAFMAKKRTRFGLQLAPIYQTRATFEHLPKEPSLFIMMSDQNPSNRRKAQWVEFLNRETACLHGADRWARTLNVPVVYMHIQRVKRGFYEISFEPLYLAPKDTSDGAITQAFMQRLEYHIRRQPTDWLWSHRRWKYDRQSVKASS